MQMIDIECDTRQDAGAVQPVKIMAGNKCDLKEARVVSSRQGLEYARSKGCGFMETSAREMVNIEETFARESHCSHTVAFLWTPRKSYPGTYVLASVD